MPVKPIPEGYHTLTPYFTVRDAARAVEFYKQAFGATERGVMKSPDGKQKIDNTNRWVVTAQREGNKWKISSLQQVI